MQDRGIIADAGSVLGGVRRPGLSTSGNEDDFLFTRWPKPDFAAAARSGRATPERAAMFLAAYSNLSPRPAPLGIAESCLDIWPRMWRQSVDVVRLMWEEGACSTIAEMLKVHDAMMQRHFPEEPLAALAPYASGRIMKKGIRHGLSLSTYNEVRMTWLPKLGWPTDRRLKDEDAFGVVRSGRDGKSWHQPVRAAAGRVDAIGDGSHHPTEAEAEAQLRIIVEGILEDRRRDAELGPGRKALGKQSVRLGPPNPKRMGKATTEDFVSVMGMRGVEFGDFIGQRERQAVLDEAFDAFFDLCSVLRIPAPGASFWGRAGIAFGSRGMGANVSGHFEPGNWVVHMDRSHGAGVLAHEMGHALDAAMAEAAGLGRGAMLSQGVAAGWLDHDAALLMKGILAGIIKNEDGDVSTFLRDAKQLDAGRRPYWAEPAELFARLFEAWVHDALSARGRRNDFLVKREAGPDLLPGQEWRTLVSPYPKRRERARMVALMDEYIKVAVPLMRRRLDPERKR